MKNIFIIGGIAIILVAGASWLSRSLQSHDTTIVSASGIHWHPHIEIFVKGERREIPANIGIGMQYAGYPHYDPRMMMTPMHTHEADGIIHMEFPGRVMENDTNLGNFLSMWGENIPGVSSFKKMTINGEETTLEDYAMKDGDRIVLEYE